MTAKMLPIRISHGSTGLGRRAEAGQDIGDVIALYDPNGAAAMIFFLVFLTVAVGYWYRHFKTDPRAKYTRPVRYGATFMALGYLCRFTRRDGINAWSWLFETMFVLLSPCAFLAQVYVLLPRLADSLDAEDCLVISGRTIKWIFILADVLTVLAQLAGTALTITFGDLVVIGKHTVTAGLWVQLAFFLTFVVIFSIFTKRLHRRPEYASKWSAASSGAHKWNERWTTLLVTMFCACICMFARSIYRVAEYTAGARSALTQSEAAFYILDAVMMLIIIVGFVVVWPPPCLDVYTLPTETKRSSDAAGPAGPAGLHDVPAQRFNRTPYPVQEPARTQPPIGMRDMRSMPR